MIRVELVCPRCEKAGDVVEYAVKRAFYDTNLEADGTVVRREAAACVEEVARGLMCERCSASDFAEHEAVEVTQRRQEAGAAAACQGTAPLPSSFDLVAHASLVRGGTLIVRRVPDGLHEPEHYDTPRRDNRIAEQLDPVCFSDDGEPLWDMIELDALGLAWILAEETTRRIILIGDDLPAELRDRIWIDAERYARDPRYAVEARTDDLTDKVWLLDAERQTGEPGHASALPRPLAPESSGPTNR